MNRAEGLKRLDAMIENVGLLTMDYAETEMVNVVLNFLSALMVLPRVYEAAKHLKIMPHLFFVTLEAKAWTSFSERDCPILFEALNSKCTARMAKRYAD